MEYLDWMKGMSISGLENVFLVVEKIEENTSTRKRDNFCT